MNLRGVDLHLALDPPQVYIAHAKGGSDGYVPILPALAQELRTYLAGRRTGIWSRATAMIATRRALSSSSCRTRPGEQESGRVTPHLLRASVATLLLDAGMPLDQVQKFLRHKRIATTQIYAQTSVRNMGESYLKAMGGRH